MMREDLSLLKSILRKNKPNRIFQKEFAEILNFHGDKNPSISEQFKLKFLKIMEAKEHLVYTNPRISQVSVITNKTALNSEQSDFPNKSEDSEDEELFQMKFRQQRQMPIKQSNQEISKICEAFEKIGPRDYSNMFSKLYEYYADEGGEMNQSQLKTKIQSDLLFLVKYKTNTK